MMKEISYLEETFPF